MSEMVEVTAQTQRTEKASKKNAWKDGEKLRY